MSTEYKIIKSDKSKGEQGKYQILETHQGSWRTCGVYFKLKDAKEGLENIEYADFKRCLDEAVCLIISAWNKKKGVNA